MKTGLLEDNLIAELNSCREILFGLGLIGQDPTRYGGVGYGNASQRLLGDFPLNNRAFIITGTSTGGIEHLTGEHYTIVLRYRPERNWVVPMGPIKSSSESMTHGAIYDSDDSVRFVFYAHSPEIWKSRGKLRIPTTRQDVEYGTPEMANEVRRLFDETDVRERGIFAMGGHEDGIVTFGGSSDEAGSCMIEYLLMSF